MKKRTLNVSRVPTTAIFLVLLAIVGCSRSVNDPIANDQAETDLSSTEGFEPSQRTIEQRLGTRFFDSSPRYIRSPRLTQLSFPDIPLANAVWGSVGRDDWGNVYLGVSCEGPGRLSASLCRISQGQTEPQLYGDSVKQLEVLFTDPQMQQAKIHCKPIQADDGYVYFTSQDESGEREDGSTLPTWGSHLWRLDPRETEVYWEHIRAIPEALIATGGTGRYVYALGYFDHVVYQFDTETRSIRRKTVGSVGGHISRNFLVDQNEHAYVPRVSRVDDKVFSVELVELDEQLNEVVSHPLDDYGATANFSSHGIVSFVTLRNGELLFTTAKGALYRVQPQEGGPSTMERLGWIHPDGESYTACLVCPDGTNTLCGLSRLPKTPGHQWVVYDLSSRTSTTLTLKLPRDTLLDRRGTLLYGCNTLDDLGNAYLVGRYRGSEGGFRPLAYRVEWPE